MSEDFYLDDHDTPKPAFVLDRHGSSDIDLSMPPADGTEYLRRVQMEAKSCPAIVVAEGFPVKQEPTFRLKTVRSCQPAPAGFAPDIHWQRMQIAKFSHDREKFSQYKSSLKESEFKSAKSRLPGLEDYPGWCRLCFGRVPSRADNFGQRTVEEQETSSNGFETTGGVLPLLSILTAMDQPTVMNVLEYHINWFEATGFTYDQGCWLFALLTALEKPLTPEACSLLRTLARHCANLRATLEGPTNPLLVQLNLLICLVARYFDQADLADET